MKREILFRGKSTGDGKWVYGHFAISQINNNDIYIIADILRSQLYPVDPKTVGQFTGKYLHETKIWEGDILRRKFKKYVVVYDDYSCSFMLRCDEACRKYHFDHWDIWSFEIIGNICDNLEY